MLNQCTIKMATCLRWLERLNLIERLDQSGIASSLWQETWLKLIWDMLMYRYRRQLQYWSWFLRHAHTFPRIFDSWLSTSTHRRCWHFWNLKNSLISMMKICLHCLRSQWGHFAAIYAKLKTVLPCKHACDSSVIRIGQCFLWISPAS